MAKAGSKTFEAAASKVWAKVLKIVSGAGYTIKETNAAAKQVVYKASGGALAWGQLVTVSVSDVDENEILVTVRVEAEGQATLAEGGQQKKLIGFIFTELEKQFALSENQQQSTGAPGTSGCFGAMLCMLTGAVSLVAWFANH